MEGLEGGRGSLKETGGGYLGLFHLERMMVSVLHTQSFTVVID